jgi:hypothetical protein
MAAVYAPLKRGVVAARDEVRESIIELDLEWPHIEWAEPRGSMKLGKRGVGITAIAQQPGMLVQCTDRVSVQLKLFLNQLNRLIQPAARSGNSCGHSPKHFRIIAAESQRDPGHLDRFQRPWIGRLPPQHAAHLKAPISA